MVIEACVTSAREARSSRAAGATRAELCRRLDVGGLTPSAGDIGSAVASAGLPIVALVRSRAGSSRLDPGEAPGLVAEVAAVARLGVAGIAVGALDRRGEVDRPLLDELVGAAAGLPVTFHRAFDEVRDPLAALDVLGRAGVARVLTSGGAATAWEGRRVLRRLVEAGQTVTVVAGGAVRGDHVRALVEEARLTDVHARASAIPEIVAALAP